MPLSRDRSQQAAHILAITFPARLIWVCGVVDEASTWGSASFALSDWWLPFAPLENPLVLAFSVTAMVSLRFAQVVEVFGGFE